MKTKTKARRRLSLNVRGGSGGRPPKNGEKLKKVFSENRLKMLDIYTQIGYNISIENKTAEAFMNYKEKFISLIKRLEYLTSEEHRKEAEQKGKYPECYILGEIEAETNWAKLELKWEEEK